LCLHEIYNLYSIFNSYPVINIIVYHLILCTVLYYCSILSVLKLSLMLIAVYISIVIHYTLKSAELLSYYMINTVQNIPFHSRFTSVSPQHSSISDAWRTAVCNVCPPVESPLACRGRKSV